VPNDFANPAASSAPVGAPEAPAGPSLRAEVRPTTARLGDLLTLDIRVVHNAAETVEPPVFAKNLGTFEVYSSTRLPTEVQGSRLTERFEAELQNFTTGPQRLPGVALTYHEPGLGTAHRLQTPELQVMIQEVPAGPHDRGDIRGIVGVIGPVAWSPLWWIVLALAICGAGIWLWTKRRRTLQGPPPPPPVPADEAALQRLAGLRAGDWMATGRLKEFYSALSDILRAYLEGGFKTPALERTTGELMRDLRHRSLFDAGRLAELRDLLESCDLVKFAKFRPEPEEALKAHTFAVQFVEQTRAALKADAPKAAAG